MFEINTKTRQEALNYATLLNVMDCTEHRLEPQFDKFAELADVGIPLIDENVIHKYVDFFAVSKDRLAEEYYTAYRAFENLRPTDEIIKRGSLYYPVLLEKTAQAPRFLYVRGKKSLLYEKKTVAVVGSRQASERAKINTRALVQKLGDYSITVVSGLAKGIDVTAHVEALRCGYNTIAVIGTNLNQYYPAENKNIQRKIEEYGVVVSQFSPASVTKNWFFPLRNGVMSGLSLATIIMEAGETSGALKQADYALRQGRQIILPKSVLEQKTITWPQKYIKKGAFVVEKPSDVLKVLAENSIIKKENEKPTQTTLDQYLESLSKSENSDIKSEWLQTIMV